MYRLGYASIHWVDAFDEEHFNPDAPEDMQCSNSLRRMRETMLETAHPDAMVCIGGMEGLEDEVSLALEQRPRFPIYVLERTGGAAALLRGRHLAPLRMIDTEIVTRVDRMRAELGGAIQPDEMHIRRAVPARDANNR
jgi:hypothetical protein